MTTNTPVEPEKGGLAKPKIAQRSKDTKPLTYRLVQLGDGLFDYMQEPQTITFKSEEHRKQFMANISKSNIGGIDLFATDPEVKS